MKALFEKLATVGQEQVKEVFYPFNGGIDKVEVPVTEEKEKPGIGGYSQEDYEKMVKAMYEEDPEPPTGDYVVQVDGDDVIIAVGDYEWETIQLVDLVKEWSHVV